MVLNTFDPSNRAHVEWLKELLEADVDKKMNVLTKNPMKQEIPPFEMIHIIFGLSAKYTKAIFDKSAFILP